MQCSHDKSHTKEGTQGQPLCSGCSELFSLCLIIQEGNKGPEVTVSITCHPPAKKRPQKLSLTPATSAVNKSCKATPVLKFNARGGQTPALHTANRGSAGGAQGPAFPNAYLLPAQEDLVWRARTAALRNLLPRAAALYL